MKMRRIFPILFSLYLATSPFTFGQEQGNHHGGLEQLLSKEELNEIRRKGSFAESNVPIVRVRVIDSESRCPVDNAIIELKHGNKRIVSSYPIGIGQQASFYPYLTKAKEGTSVFSVKKGHEGILTKLSVTHPEYEAFEAWFPLEILLQHINNPQSSPLPGSISENLKFRYLWDDATVFTVKYDKRYRDYEAIAKADEFIGKVINDEILRYIDNIFGQCFYAYYLGKPLMYLPSNEEFHVLIPIEIELKRLPVRIKIEE